MPFSIETLKAGLAPFAASIFGGASDASIKPLPTTRDKSARVNTHSPSVITLSNASAEDYKVPSVSQIMEQCFGFNSRELENFNAFRENTENLNLSDEKDVKVFFALLKKDLEFFDQDFEQKAASSPLQIPAASTSTAAVAPPAIQSKMAIACAVTTPTTHIREENINVEALTNQNNTIPAASSNVKPYQLDFEEPIFAHLEIPQIGVKSTNQTVFSKITSPIVTRHETVIANLNTQYRTVKEQQEKIKDFENEKEKSNKEIKELKNENRKLRGIITELRETNQQQQVINKSLLDGLNALHQEINAIKQSRSSSRATSRSSRSHRSDRSDALSVQAETRPTSPTDLIDRLSIRPTLSSYEADPSSSAYLPSYSSSSEPNQAFIMPRAEAESEFGYSSEEESSDMHSSVYTISDSGDSSYIAMSPRSLPDNHAHSVA